MHNPPARPLNRSKGRNHGHSLNSIPALFFPYFSPKVGRGLLSAARARFALLTRSKTHSTYFSIHKYVTLVNSFCTERVYSGKLNYTKNCGLFCSARARFALLTRSKILSLYFPILRYITLVVSFCTERVYSGKLNHHRQTDTALLSSIGLKRNTIKKQVLQKRRYT